jgi:cytochrome b
MTGNEVARTTRSPRGVLVWDPVVRFGHWGLVAAFAAAYLSAEEEAGGPAPVHVWAGYVVGAIVVLRVLWGFVGSRHARFADFVRGPFETSIYLRNLLLGRARRFLGHSPAGGAMVVALLICLAATVATGMVAYGEQGKGPLAANGAALIGSARTGTDRAQPATPLRGEESTMVEIHDMLAATTVALIVAHICGVALASFVHRENLVLAMVSGRKRHGHDG